MTARSTSSAQSLVSMDAHSVSAWNQSAYHGKGCQATGQSTPKTAMAAPATASQPRVTGRARGTYMVTVGEDAPQKVIVQLVIVHLRPSQPSSRLAYETTAPTARPPHSTACDHRRALMGGSEYLAGAHCGLHLRAKHSQFHRHLEVPPRTGNPTHMRPPPRVPNATALEENDLERQGLTP